MQTANCSVQLPDGRVVPKFGVTPGEIMVLRSLHGEASVTDVFVREDAAEFSGDREFTRLRNTYGARRVDGAVGLELPDTFDGLPAHIFQGYGAAGTADDAAPDIDAPRKRNRG